MSQMILDWQNSLERVFGIKYSGPKDGIINDSLIEAITELESRHNANGVIYNGRDIKITVEEAKKRFQKNQYDWISFLSQDLPLVGNIYKGDLKSAAKQLEKTIGIAIGESLDGMIWDESNNDFKTTPQDIKRSLELIKMHKKPKSATTREERIIKMTKWLLK